MNLKVKKVRKNLVAVIILVAAAGFTSCEKYSYLPPSVDPLATWHFQTDIQPIFNANCISCHGGTRSPDLRDGKSYTALTKGGYVTAPANTSRLYAQMINSSHLSRSNDADKLKVLYWITQGSQNN
jgi:hypothetical protein